MKKYAFYTGPCIVDQVAAKLTEAGLVGVWAGTQHVYFSLPFDDSDNRAGAQAAINAVYPHAGFEVAR